MDTPTDATEQSWGAKVNTHTVALRPSNCPAWASRKQQQKWCEQGLVIWDHAHQSLIRLHPRDALTVLDDLRQRTDWHQDGITIGEIVIVWDTASKPYPSKRSGRPSQTTTLTLDA